MYDAQVVNCLYLGLSTWHWGAAHAWSIFLLQLLLVVTAGCTAAAPDSIFSISWCPNVELLLLLQVARHEVALAARLPNLVDLLLGWALDPALPDHLR